VIIFRVLWVDDNGEIHINKVYHIEINGANIGKFIKVANGMLAQVKV
jgi:hypothetical protein